MNEANVREIEKALSTVVPMFIPAEWYRPLAEKLAAQGLLAPSALTDNQLRDAWESGQTYGGPPGDNSSYCGEYADMRVELERIAKGTE